MSDTIKEFTDFISNDPLMMALCVAILFLIIVFILVLIIGNKKDKKKKKNNQLDNTESLLKVNTNNEALKSTQEFSAITREAEKELAKTKELPTVEAAAEDLAEQNAPINIDEALKLKESREISEKGPTIKIPVTDLTEEISKEANEAPLSVPPVMEPIKEDVPTLNTDSEAKPPLSAVGVQGKEMPKLSQDLSQTQIIRHVSKPEENKNESDGDIELPKLNNGNLENTLSTIAGETFELK